MVDMATENILMMRAILCFGLVATKMAAESYVQIDGFFANLRMPFQALSLITSSIENMPSARWCQHTQGRDIRKGRIRYYRRAYGMAGVIEAWRLYCLTQVKVLGLSLVVLSKGQMKVFATVSYIEPHLRYQWLETAVTEYKTDAQIPRGLSEWS